MKAAMDILENLSVIVQGSFPQRKPLEKLDCDIFVSIISPLYVMLA